MENRLGMGGGGGGQEAGVIMDCTRGLRGDGTVLYLIVVATRFYTTHTHKHTHIVHVKLVQSE